MPRGRAAMDGPASEESEMENVGEPARRRGVIAITRREEKFLVIRRGVTVAAGGTICFPGGPIEPGEEEHEAVVRACHEDLAAIVEPAECIWRSVSPWGTPLAWWTVRLVGSGELVPHPIEVAEILWLSVEEMLADPTLLEGNRPFLEAIRGGRVAV